MNAQPPSPEHDADCSAVRAALRREKLAARLALTAADHAALSTRVAVHLATLLDTLPPQTLAFCAPVRGEFDAARLVVELLAKGWKAAMPVVVTPGAPKSAPSESPNPCCSKCLAGLPIPLSAANSRASIHAR